MKKTIDQFLFFGFIVLLGCSNSNAEKNKTKTTSESTTEAKTDESLNTTAPGDGIIGDWKLALETYDDNGNKKLDEDERKKAFSNHYFYRFSADGKCLVNFLSKPGGFKGHYTIDKSTQKISIYLDEGERPGLESEHYIISVNKDELVLLDAYTNLTFWIFKRG